MSCYPLLKPTGHLRSSTCQQRSATPASPAGATIPRISGSMSPILIITGLPRGPKLRVRAAATTSRLLCSSRIKLAIVQATLKDSAAASHASQVPKRSPAADRQHGQLWPQLNPQCWIATGPVAIQTASVTFNSRARRRCRTCPNTTRTASMFPQALCALGRSGDLRAYKQRTDAHTHTHTHHPMGAPMAQGLGPGPPARNASEASGGGGGRARASNPPALGVCALQAVLLPNDGLIHEMCNLCLRCNLLRCNL